MHQSLPDADLDTLRAKAVALAYGNTSPAFQTYVEFGRIAVRILSREEIAQSAE
jgi:hypothetical protein